ncbi:MAG: hypothetical protein WDO18_20550 [Acidobacteriota bacterium]
MRLDSVQNYASHLAQALAPGEPIVASGSGFGAGAQIILDGSPLATVRFDADVHGLPWCLIRAAIAGLHTLQVFEQRHHLERGLHSRRGCVALRFIRRMAREQGQGLHFQ